jgi:hypothetical protein
MPSQNIWPFYRQQKVQMHRVYWWWSKQWTAGWFWWNIRYISCNCASKSPLKPDHAAQIATWATGVLPWMRVFDMFSKISLVMLSSGSSFHRTYVDLFCEEFRSLSVRLLFNVHFDGLILSILILRLSWSWYVPCFYIYLSSNVCWVSAVIHIINFVCTISEYVVLKACPSIGPKTPPKDKKQSFFFS